MRYRQLGRTGLTVSEIGFGAWGIGGVSKNVFSYGPTDDQESKEALLRAFDAGITFYDTADLYGDGHSEALIGSTFKNIRQKVIIASKAGFLGSDGRQDFSLSHLEKSLKSSLERLQTDYLDLYQLHGIPMELLQANIGILDFFRNLQKAGTIRAFGISVRSPEDGIRAIKEFGFQAIQANFNMTDQRARETGLFDLCEKENAGIICRTPLCFGFLTGKYPAGALFHPDDHRRRWGAKQIERWAAAYRLFRSGIHTSEAQTDAQIALRFCLSYPAVSTVIPGMLTKSHVDENSRASVLGPLDSASLLEIERIYQENVFFIR